MILAADLGNSNITLGLFEGDQLKAVLRLMTDRAKTSGEYCRELQTILEKSQIAVGDITAAVLASVVPGLTKQFAEALRQALKLKPRVIDHDTDFGIVNKTDQPGAVGIDRLVNVAAAWHYYGGPALVIDFGTATTYDLVTARGEFSGGIIAPGIRSSAEALWEKTAKLPRIDIEKPPRILGTNTVSSMQSGVFYGYLGQVEYLVNGLQAESDAELTVIATGGLSGLFNGCTDIIDRYDENLTLFGLKYLLEKK